MALLLALSQREVIAMLTQVLDRSGHKVEAVVTGNPGGNSLPGSPAGGAAPKPLTWGDRVLRRRIRVLRLEPCTQTGRRFSGDTDSPIDGELYTPDCRRGNIRALVVKGGTPRAKVGETFKLHPFTGSSKGASPSNALPVRFYEGKRKPKGDAEAPNTEVTARIPDEVLALVS